MSLRPRTARGAVRAADSGAPAGDVVTLSTYAAAALFVPALAGKEVAHPFHRSRQRRWVGHYDAVPATERRIEVSAGAVEGVADVEHDDPTAPPRDR